MRSRQSHILALVLLIAVVLGFMPGFRAQAEEGMFPLDVVAKLDWADLAKHGMKLKPTDIYNPNGVSFTDAIVRVEIGTNGFGSGEFVSPNGLLLTNHHVGFDGLVAASAPGKNYGETGFKANSQAEELPAKNYSVRMTTEIKDVTSDILSAVNANMSPGERNQAIAKDLTRVFTTTSSSIRSSPTCASFMLRRKASAFSEATSTIFNGRATAAISLSCACIPRPTESRRPTPPAMFRFIRKST